MNFRINSDDTDITTLANQLRDLEQEGKSLSPEQRALLNRSAHMLECCRSQMLSTIEELKAAMLLKTGYSASDSRQIEVAQQRKAMIEQQIEFLNVLVNQRTPAPRASQRQSGEVI